MKTISMHTTTIANIPSTSSLSGTNGTLVWPGRGQQPAWRPVPALQKTKPAALAPGKSATVTRSIWIPIKKETLAERAAFGAIALGALAAIGYGLVCLLDLVQNWALFHGGIARLLQ